MGEVMRRMRPFKDAFFTPSPKDAEEEARWALEEREKEEEARERQLQEKEEEVLQQHERELQEQITMAHRAAEEDEAAEVEVEGKRGREGEAVAEALSGVILSTTTTRALSRNAQCPFTGGRLSRSISNRSSAAAVSKTLSVNVAVTGSLSLRAQDTGVEAPRPNRCAALESVALAAVEAGTEPPFASTPNDGGGDGNGVSSRCTLRRDTAAVSGSSIVQSADLSATVTVAEA